MPFFRVPPRFCEVEGNSGPPAIGRPGERCADDLAHDPLQDQRPDACTEKCRNDRANTAEKPGKHRAIGERLVAELAQPKRHVGIASAAQNDRDRKPGEHRCQLRRVEQSFGHWGRKHDHQGISRSEEAIGPEDRVQLTLG